MTTRTMFFSRPKSLSPAEAATALQRRELQLVDVREAGELSRGGVRGSIHIPLGQLSGRLAGLDRDRPVAFICQSGSRSARATRVATKAGFDAANVSGGVAGWQRAGLPLTTPHRAR
jgi:rhodanese-related sulfurtransferase